MAFSPDGRTLYSGSYDGSAIAWDVSGARRLGRPFPLAPSSAPSSFQSDVSPDGSRFATSPGPNEVELWNSSTRAVVRELRGPVGDSHDIRFSPDGRLVGVAGSKHAVVWVVRTGKIMRAFPVGPAMTGGSNTVAFSPDGRVLAVQGAESEIRLYDLRTGEPVIKLPADDGTPQDIDFSPDGTLLASATLAGEAELWDAKTGRSLARVSNGSNHQAFDSAVSFSPDGKLLAIGDTSGKVVLWDVTKRRPVGRPLAGQDVSIHTVDFDPSGQMLITMSSDGNLRLWDVATQKLIGAPIPVSTGDGSAEFFPDGTHVFGDFGPTGVVWNVDPVAWEAQACRVAHRNLTREEWNDFLGQRRYRPVCRVTH